MLRKKNFFEETNLNFLISFSLYFFHKIIKVATLLFFFWKKHSVLLSGNFVALLLSFTFGPI